MFTFQQMFLLSFDLFIFKHVKKIIIIFIDTKKLSLWNKIKYLNHNIFRT